jgi:hypothetical protein
MSTHLYPCQCPEGHHLSTYPRAEIDVATKREAKWLVATKAFSYDPDGLHAVEETHESATWPPPDTDPNQPDEPEA